MVEEERREMRYVKTRDDEVDWVDDEPARPLVRTPFDGTLGERITKITKVDARLLALARGGDQPPTAPPPAAEDEAPTTKRAVVPPALPLPFPFANMASSPISVAVTTLEDGAVYSGDAWVPVPREASLAPAAPSVSPREPDPFTVHPPATFTFPPR